MLRYRASVKIISNRALRAFAAVHPEAEAPLRGWRRVIETNRFPNWAALKSTFGTVDRVGELAVFDIGGNKYRLIAFVRFEKQIVYVEAILSHRQYDKWVWKQ